MIDDMWIHASHEVDVWEAAPLADLIIHIVEHYHLEARVLLARLENLMAEAVLLEGGEHPGLFAIRDQVDHFSKGFRAHVSMEEQSLFPTCWILDPAARLS
jgi:iron-sulfur cluster repair protein YtfE (RIC family)